MMTKMTPDYIEGLIVGEEYLRQTDGTMTICILQLANGCTVQGTSNCIDPANFNEEIGKQVSRQNAAGKIWELEGYAIKRDFMLIERAAKAAHEVSRVYCETIGDTSQVAWDDAPEWQKESVREGIRHVLRNPDVTPEMSHDSWAMTKLDDGWTYGPVKDVEAKTHPCLVPYDKLPEEQKAKDRFFLAVAKTFL